MLKWELKKILFKNKGIFIILAVVILNACFFLTQGCEVSPNVPNDAYMTYIDQYKGKLNQKKSDLIEAEYDKVYNSRDYISQLQSQYQKGEISEAQLQKQSEVYVRDKANMNAFRYFYNQYLNAKKDEAHHYILNTRGWDLLFNDHTTPIILLLLAICICVPNFSKEYEREMDQLQLCCEHGRTKLFLTKVAAASILLMFTVLLISVIDLSIAWLKFDLSGFLYPMQSIAFLDGSHLSMGLLPAYLLSVLLKLVASVFICAFSALLSITLKNQIVAFITVLLVNMFPFLVFMGTNAFLSLPIPGDLLFSAEYLKGDQFQQVIVSESFVSKKVLSGLTDTKFIFLFLLIFACIAILLYLSNFFYLHKKVSRKLRNIIPCLFIVLLLSGCTSHMVRNTNFIYDGTQMTTATIGKDEFRLSDDCKQIVLERNGTQTNVIKDPLFDQQIECIFVDGNDCYYAYHVLGKLCFAKVNLQTFANTIVYYSGETNQQDYFGTVQAPSEETMMINVPVIINMFCDSRYIYYFTMDGSFYSIDLQTRKKVFIADDCNSGSSNYYYYGKIYYINTVNQLVCFDTKTMKKTIVPHVYLDSFQIQDNSIVYIDKFSNEKGKIPLKK